MSPVAASVPALPPPATVRMASTTPSGWAPYIVRAGDTLYDIAARTGTSVTALVQRNTLPGGGRLIHIGSMILTPAPAPVLHGPGAAPARPAATPPPAPATSSAGPTSTSSYRVVSGDTVEGIAAKTGASQTSLITANGLSAPYLIQIGQVLRVVKPVATAANTFEGRTYPAATVAAATAARNALARSHVPTRTQMRATIAATADRYGVDPRLALAIAYLESGWDQRQVSVANAIGAMQVIPSSGQWASDLAGRPLNLLVAQDNATAGVVILRALVQSSPSLEVAIAGYYQGLGSVQQNGMYADTARYVANVTALMSRS